MRRGAALAAAVIMTITWLASGPVSQGRAAECVSFVGPGIPPPAVVPVGVDGFHASWYGQSGYMTLCPGEMRTATVAYYNSGSLGWVSGRLGQVAYLGTWDPEPGQDRPSVLGGDGAFGSPNTGWPRYNRLAVQPSAYVGPGQVAWFQFPVRAPASPGTYRIALRPLIEGAQWMEDFGVFWVVTVPPLNVAVSGSPTPTPVATFAPPTPTPVASSAPPTPSPATPTPAATASAPPTAPVVGPTPPATYAIPAGAISVSTSAGLLAELQKSAAENIVIEDGVYDNPTAFLNPHGHHLYARHLGGALFTAGFSMGGNGNPGEHPGGLLRGLAFNVVNRAKTDDGRGYIVLSWAPVGAGVQVLDSTFEGNAVCAAGTPASSCGMKAAVWSDHAEGLVVQRISVQHFTDFGVGMTDEQNATDPSYALPTPYLFSDIDVSHVGHPTPREANGTAEACIWLANNGTLQRARVRDCAWMGIWTGGNAKNGGVSLTDLDIDQTPKGIYAEHYSWGATYQRFFIGPNTVIGVNAEWADPLTGGLPACQNCRVESGTIQSCRVGVNYDLGTSGSSVRNVKFQFQSIAAIIDYNTASTNTYSNNDYTTVAVQISHSAPPNNAFTCP